MGESNGIPAYVCWTELGKHTTGAWDLETALERVREYERAGTIVYRLSQGEGINIEGEQLRRMLDEG